MPMRKSQPSRRAKGSVDLKFALILYCGLLAVFLLADRLWQSRSEKPLDIRGWELTDLLAHLQKRGVHLHVVNTRKDGDVRGSVYLNSVYLSKDPNATWLSLAGKKKVVESIHDWTGTVWVGHALSPFDAEDRLAQWGANGCQIGGLLLFGDEQLLRCIQEACR